MTLCPHRPLWALDVEAGRAYAESMLRLLRFAVLVLMFFITVSLIIAVARPETGPAEKLVLGAAVVGLLFAAVPVQRIGPGRA